MSPAEIAAMANSLQPADNYYSRAIYAGKPQLSATSSREELIGWCMWCDKDGCYSDEDCLAEFGVAMTLDEAWGAVEMLLED